MYSATISSSNNVIKAGAKIMAGVETHKKHQKQAETGDDDDDDDDDDDGGDDDDGNNMNVNNPIV